MKPAIHILMFDFPCFWIDSSRFMIFFNCSLLSPGGAATEHSFGEVQHIKFHQAAWSHSLCYIACPLQTTSQNGGHDDVAFLCFSETET